MIEIKRGDCLSLVKKIEDESVDCIICDPPYFLSNDGITCKSGKMVSVNKGNWDKKDGYKEIYDFNFNWIKESYRILKKGGTMWISGTYHNIYIIGSIIQSLGDFRILNNITWVKKSPPPNLSCRFFTNSTETILWVRKGLKSKHYFDYELMKSFNENKQMKDVWIIGRPKKEEYKLQDKFNDFKRLFEEQFAQLNKSNNESLFMLIQAIFKSEIEFEINGFKSLVFNYIKEQLDSYVDNMMRDSRLLDKLKYKLQLIHDSPVNESNNENYTKLIRFLKQKYENE